jgi:hypothetical protein
VGDWFGSLKGPLESQAERVNRNAAQMAKSGSVERCIE